MLWLMACVVIGYFFGKIVGEILTAIARFFGHRP